MTSRVELNDAQSNASQWSGYWDLLVALHGNNGGWGQNIHAVATFVCFFYFNLTCTLSSITLLFSSSFRKVVSSYRMITLQTLVTEEINTYVQDTTHRSNTIMNLWFPYWTEPIKDTASLKWWSMTLLLFQVARSLFFSLAQFVLQLCFSTMPIKTFLFICNTVAFVSPIFKLSDCPCEWDSI